MENDKNILYRNLVILLKIFRDRPNHLSKYLIENSAFSDEFIQNIINSDKLNNMRPNNNNYFQDENLIQIPLNFTDYEEMDEYYDSIISDTKQLDDIELINEMNSRLSKYISEEKYEEASKIRDYMIKHNMRIDI